MPCRCHSNPGVQAGAGGGNGQETMIFTTPKIGGVPRVAVGFPNCSTDEMRLAVWDMTTTRSPWGCEAMGTPSAGPHMGGWPA